MYFVKIISTNYHHSLAKHCTHVQMIKVNTLLKQKSISILILLDCLLVLRAEQELCYQPANRMEQKVVKLWAWLVLFFGLCNCFSSHCAHFCTQFKKVQHFILFGAQEKIQSRQQALDCNIVFLLVLRFIHESLVPETTRAIVQTTHAKISCSSLTEEVAKAEVATKIQNLCLGTEIWPLGFLLDSQLLFNNLTTAVSNKSALEKKQIQWLYTVLLFPGDYSTASNGMLNYILEVTQNILWW